VAKHHKLEEDKYINAFLKDINQTHEFLLKLNSELENRNNNRTYLPEI
jgi:hypothetical protein